MSILEQLAADFRPRAKELKSTTIKLEGLGEEIVIYFRGVANCKQTDKYLPLLQDGKIEGYVELVLARSLNEHGQKIFKPKDKQALMTDVDPEVLTDLGNTILGVDEQAGEIAQDEAAEVAKKSD